MRSRLLKLQTGLLSLCLLFQCLVFSSGLFGFILSEGAKICQCNHSSKKEKHSSPEDSLIAKKSVLGSSNNPGQTIPFNPKNISNKTLSVIESDSLPHCHDSKAGEAHLCNCKKSEKTAEMLLSHRQTLFIQRFTEILKPKIFFTYSNFLDQISTMDGYTKSIFRPPRIC